jgi:hypothetical protein
LPFEETANIADGQGIEEYLYQDIHRTASFNRFRTLEIIRWTASSAAAADTTGFRGEIPGKCHKGLVPGGGITSSWHCSGIFANRLKLEKP